MSYRRSTKGDVAWYVPGRKTPIGHTTTASSALIRFLADRDMTFSEAYERINYDPEAKAILLKYIERGHGDTLMADLGVK